MPILLVENEGNSEEEESDSDEEGSAHDQPQAQDVIEPVVQNVAEELELIPISEVADMEVNLPTIDEPVAGEETTVLELGSVDAQLTTVAGAEVPSFPALLSTAPTSGDEDCCEYE